MAVSIGHQFIASLVLSGEPADIVKFGKIDHLFTDSELGVYQFIQAHTLKHGALPKPPTIEAELQVEVGEGFTEPTTYYLDKLRSRHVERSLRASMLEVGSYFKPGEKDPLRALQRISDTVFDLLLSQHGASVVDFRYSYDQVVQNYATANKGIEPGVGMGWPTLDTASGGLQPGDTVAVVGRPGLGKTFLLLYSAMHAWQQQRAPLFISMEMNPRLIQERLAAMHAHVPLTMLRTGELETFNLRKLKRKLSEAEKAPQPFYIVDGNLTASVNDIYILARQLKPAIVFVDGAYLLRREGSRDRYNRAADNCEDLKALIASELGIPVVSSWQFNRNADKLKNKGGATLSDIGYTDAVGQISSIVLGLSEEESVETSYTRKIDIMKGRSGEAGSFNVGWDFRAMDFGEVLETKGGVSYV